MRCSCALVLVAASGLLTGCMAPDAVPGSLPADGSLGGFEQQWAKSFGYKNDTNSPQRARDVAVSADGALVALAMDFEGGLEGEGLPEASYYSYGQADLLIAAYGVDRTALWAKRLGDGFKQAGASVAIDGGRNVFVAGFFEGALDFGMIDPITSVTIQSNANSADAFVAKLDPTGKPIWAHAYGNEGTQFATDVAVDVAGNVFLVGYAGGEIDFGGGPVTHASTDDIFIARLNPAGGHVWSKRIGRAGHWDWEKRTVRVAVTGDGRVVVAGYAEDELNIPNLDMPDRGDRTAFVAMLDGQGNGLWGKTFGDPGHEQKLLGLSVSPSGAVAIAGEMQGTISFGGPKFSTGEDNDVFVAVLDGSGKHAWSRAFGSRGQQRAWDVAFDPKDNLFVVGEFSGVLGLYGDRDLMNVDVGNTWSDAFVVQFDATGEALRARAYGSKDSWQDARAVAVDKKGHAFVAGIYTNEIDFGAGPLVSTGSEDAFLVELAP